MAKIDDQLEHARGEARKALEQLFSLNVKEAAIRPNLGDLNFTEALPAIDRIYGLFRMIQSASLDYVSIGKLTELTQVTNEVTQHLKQIEAFSLQIDNASAQRNNIITTIKSSYNTWFDRLFPIISFMIRSTTDFASLENDLRQKIANTEVILADAVKKQSDVAKEAAETLESIKKAAAEAGVSQEAVHFKTEADKHEQRSKTWLKATVSIGVATVGWGLAVIWAFTVPTDATLAQVLNLTLGKVIILIALYSTLIWCARNYAASQHNFVVNKHRQNALSTFETFAKAASSEDVKQAVLLQATTSIFASQSSGFHAKEADNEQSSKVIEILRSVGSTSKAVS